MTQALFTSMTGLNAGTEQLTVVSDNVANMNTTAYKTSRVDFQDIWYMTKTEGTSSTRNSGGTNPYQVGVGVQCASISKDFGAGSINTTGRSEDLAITGDGWFTVVNSDEEVLLTRDGTFALDENGYLCTANGAKLLGMDKDASYLRSNTPIKIPIQVKIVENGTEQSKFKTKYSNELNALDTTYNGISSGKFKVLVYENGEAQDEAITVDLGDTSGLNMEMLANKITDAASNGNGGHYFTCTAEDGYLKFTLEGDTTKLNFESISSIDGGSNFVSATGLSSMPLIDGAYETPILDMQASVSQVDDVSDPTTKIYKSFNIGEDGLLTARYSDGSYLSVEKDSNGYAYFSYTNANGVIIKGDAKNSNTGSLVVDSNILTTANMQVQLAKVTNNYGLVAQGNNQYQIGVDCGDVIYTAANINGVGGLVSGALESSNVDLAQQFSTMILAQRLVQANSQVFNSANSMLETLVYLGR